MQKPIAMLIVEALYKVSSKLRLLSPLKYRTRILAMNVSIPNLMISRHCAVSTVATRRSEVAQQDNNW